MLVGITTLDKYFAQDFIPKVIKSYAKKYYIKSLPLEREIKRLNIGVNSVLEIINYAMDNAKVVLIDGSYDLEIGKNCKIGIYEVETLLNLITYGNANTKGNNILTKAIKYVKDNLMWLRKLYVKNYC